VDGLHVTDGHAHACLQWTEPVEVLLFQMERIGVRTAVLVQLMNGADNNDYLLECVRRHPGRFATVLSPPPAADASTSVEALVAAGASGVRLPATRTYDGRDAAPLWQAANVHGLSISVLGGVVELASPELADLVAATGDVPIVIEHLGGRTLDGDDSLELRRTVFGLSRFPNAYLKVTGLGELVHRTRPFQLDRPFGGPVPPYFQLALEAFGPERLMWGSDFPVVSGREGYANALASADEQLAGLGAGERALVFGEVARSVFPLRG
jgi:L-fuconolactonase